MKIAFLHPKNEFTEALFAELHSKLPDHELLSWTQGEAVPDRDVELLIALGKVGPEQLDGLSKLAFIQTASTGFESVDQDAASEQGIWVSYAPSAATGNAVSVAEYAMMLLLAASRHLRAFLEREKTPGAAPPMIHAALQGKTLCIVGLGDVGEALLERLQGFGMTILAADEHPERAPSGVKAYKADQLEEAVQDADYVVICVRASEENENLVDGALLRRMKRGAMLVNIARGTLVDESALLEAVRSGQIAAAGLDVVREEPLKPTNPLLSLPEILVTPHLAGFTDIMLHGTADYVVKVIGEVAAGKKPESVLNNPEPPRLALSS